MNERRAHLARNILALGAMFGGMPIYPNHEREPEPYPEAKALAVDFDVAYVAAERAYLRLGFERAREVLDLCKRNNIALSDELFGLVDQLDVPPLSTIDELSAAFQKAKADPASLLRPAIPEARQQRRSLAERKARRAKRKQKGKR